MQNQSGTAVQYILSVCLNPVLQKTLLLPHLWENEVNRSQEYYLDASGKGVNVSRVLKQQGLPVLHLTHAGGIYRELFLKLCAEDGLTLRHTDSGSEIRFCYTLLNREKGSTTEIVEEAKPVRSGTEVDIKALYRELLDGAGIVIISGTKAAGYSEELYPQLVKAAGKAGKQVILDIKGSDLQKSLEYQPYIIKPNYAEFVSTFFTGRIIRESEEGEALLPPVLQQMRELFDRYGVRTVLTRGKYPTIFFNGKEIVHLEPESCPIPVNTIGCGDAFTAGLAAGCYRGESLEAAVAAGHICAYQNALSLRPGDIMGKV